MHIDTTAAEAIVAFVAPLVASFVKQEGWPSSVNGFVAIGVYVALGALAVVTSGQTFTLDNIVPAVTIFTTVGTAAYMAFWQNTALEGALTASTSIVKPPTSAQSTPVHP